MIARPALTLSLRFVDRSHRHLVARHQVARWIRAALSAPAEIAVRVLPQAEARALNLAYRRRDYATNVLTFDYQKAPQVVADLALCAPVIEHEARAAGIDLVAHYAHLVVHGTLHAQGYDHLKPAQARRMENLESAILQRLGFANPYP